MAKVTRRPFSHGSTRKTRRVSPNVSSARASGMTTVST